MGGKIQYGMSSHPMKLRHGNSNHQRLSSSSSYDSTVSTNGSSKATMVNVPASVLPTEDVEVDLATYQQLQSRNNTLQEENAALRSENMRLKLMGSVLREQTPPVLLKEVHQLRDRNAKQQVKMEAMEKELSEADLLDMFLEESSVEISSDDTDYAKLSKRRSKSGSVLRTAKKLLIGR